MSNISKELWESFDKDWFDGRNYKKRIFAIMVQLTEKWEELDYATDFFGFKEVGFFKNDRKIPLFTKKYIKILEKAINEEAFYTLKKKREKDFETAIEIADDRINFTSYTHGHYKANWLLTDLRIFNVIIQDENEFVDIAQNYGIKKNTALKAWRERHYPFEMSYEDVKKYGESIIKFIKENDI